MGSQEKPLDSSALTNRQINRSGTHLNSQKAGAHLVGLFCLLIQHTHLVITHALFSVTTSRKP